MPDPDTHDRGRGDQCSLALHLFPALQVALTVAGFLYILPSPSPSLNRLTPFEESSRGSSIKGELHASFDYSARHFISGFLGTCRGCPKKIAVVEGVTEYRLANGARVLLFPEVSRPTITVNMTVLVGSRHEGYGETGMAHLLEHIVFKGTPTFPDVPKALRDHGASFNGTTNVDRTNYFETMPATR